MSVEQLQEQLAAFEAALATSEAARAASEAARAAAEALAASDQAALAAAEAQVADLTAKLHAFAPEAVPRPDDFSVRTARASLRFPHEQLLSPTTDGARCFLEGDFVALICAPASLVVDPDLAPAFSALLSSCGGARGVMKEASCYGRATAHLPAFAEPVGAPAGDASAVTLFTEAAMLTAAWSFAPRCKPELHVRARVGGGEGGAPAFRPGFNGELKSAGDGRALEQAAYYAAMDMVRVFFPAVSLEDGGALRACARRFFSRPPLGFALVGFPHVAYYIALEWVGKLLVSLASAPFLIGSSAHREAAAALPDARYEPPEDLEGAALPWLTPAAEAVRDRTAWRVADGLFRKLVRGDARSGEGFAAMHRAYIALGALLPTAPAHLHLVAFARLKYGAHEVLVELPAVEGREAGDEEVTAPGTVLSGAAASVAWLATQGVLYCDLRGPNVLVDAEGAPWLVDFDDCEAVPPMHNEEDFAAALATTRGAEQQGTFAARYCAGMLPGVRLALREAFKMSAEGAAGGALGAGKV